MTAAFDFSPFRDASALAWEQHTVFAPGQGDDGDLVTDTGYRLPVDVYTVAGISRGRQDWPPMSEGIGIAVVEDPATLDETREAVRDWCREHVGRDDVTFED